MSEPLPLEELASLPEIYHPVASPSGDTIAFYWNVTGRNELHLLDVASGETRQLTDGEVPRNARWPLMWGGDGDRIYFHRDQDGDEQNDVWAVDLDGDAEPVVRLEGQCIIQDAGRDGETLLFGATASGQMNLHRYDAGADEQTRLTDYDWPVSSAALAPEGDRVAYVTNESDDYENRDVYVAAADGSDPRRLAVGEEGSNSSVADWSRDGETLLVSDDAADMNRVGVYDLSADEVEWFGDGTHEERAIAFAPDGDGLLAMRTREGAVLPVHYDLDGDGTELADADGVTVVSSLGSGSAFLDDSTALAGRTSPTDRTELVAVDLSGGGREVLLEAEYGDIDPDAFLDAEYVTYESTDDLEIGALCYDSGERPSPGVVMVHGGPHGMATRRFNAQLQFLLSKGYSVLQPNYRGSVGRGREFKNMIHGDWGGMEAEDVAEGGRWFKGRDWIDEKRVAVAGGSYGGYSTYVQLTKHPELWTTGIARVGITDLHRLFEEDMPHFQKTLLEQMGDPEENYDLWRERSPIEHVDLMERPVLIVHGVNDPRCPISQARLFRDALLERGWEEGEDFEYHELDEEGHGSTDIDQKIRAYRIIEEYVDRRL